MATKKGKAPVASTEILNNASATQHLRQIANVLAFLALQSDSLKGKEKYKDLIPLVVNWGFDRHATAALLQTSPESVSVRMSEIKAASKSKSNKNKTQVALSAE